jgi:hypothetical protein
MNMRATNTLFSGALALTLVAGFGSGAAYADKIYKWVDANGVTHYGEKAPKEAEAAKVKVTDTTSSDADAELEKLNKVRESRRQSGDEAAPEVTGGKKSELDEANRKACEAHKKNLEALKSGKRARALGPDGKARVMSEEEKQAHIKLAEDELKRCENLEKLKSAEKKSRPAS